MDTFSVSSGRSQTQSLNLRVRKRCGARSYQVTGCRQSGVIPSRRRGELESDNAKSLLKTNPLDGLLVIRLHAMCRVVGRVKMISLHGALA